MRPQRTSRGEAGEIALPATRSRLANAIDTCVSDPDPVHVQFTLEEARYLRLTKVAVAFHLGQWRRVRP